MIYINGASSTQSVTFFLLLRKILIILEAIGVVGRREYEYGDVVLTRRHVVRY